jgi:GNAT superfamily N-acetyltransferase
MTAAIHYGILPGAIGRITERHATYYNALAGFGVFFEAKGAREVADFCERYVDTRDGLWLATHNDRIEDAIAIDGSHAAAGGAHLRWFITSEQIRGAGNGSSLLSSALAFAQGVRQAKVLPRVVEY